MSVTNFGITSVGIAPVGMKSFSTTGPLPSARFPSPKFVPSNVKLDTVTQRTSFSLAPVGVPAFNLLFASKKAACCQSTSLIYIKCLSFTTMNS